MSELPDVVRGNVPLKEVLSYYTVRTYCPNCNDHDAIRVRKGVLKPKTVKCLNCGCETAAT